MGACKRLGFLKGRPGRGTEPHQTSCAAPAQPASLPPAEPGAKLPFLMRMASMCTEGSDSCADGSEFQEVNVFLGLGCGLCLGQGGNP